MPGVGNAAMEGIKQQGCVSPAFRGQGRVHQNLSETRGKSLMAGIVQVVLIPEEDDLVAHQGRANCSNSRVIKPGGEFDPADFSANSARDRGNIQSGRVARSVEKGHVVHDKTPNFIL